MHSQCALTVYSIGEALLRQMPPAWPYPTIMTYAMPDGRLLTVPDSLARRHRMAWWEDVRNATMFLGTVSVPFASRHKVEAEIESFLTTHPAPDSLPATKEPTPMSFSFTVRAASAALASAAVAEKLAEVVASQPVHEADQAQVQAAVDSYIELLRDDGSRDVQVSVSGSLSYNTPDSITGASLSINASLAQREQTADQA